LGRLQLDDGSANAIQDAWLAEVGALLDEAEADESHTLIVTGRPGFFSGGLDLKVLPRLPGDELRSTTDRFVATMRRLFLFPKPVVAASAGHAIAGGMMIYLAADVRVALRDERSHYGLNEAVTGIPLLGGTAGICQYSIPPQHHTEMILHGRMLSAEQTFERGVTHALADDPQALEALAVDRANALSDVELGAYAVNKLILRQRAFEQAVEAAEALASEWRPRSNPFASIER
jgi:enoyl-CoA hydratase